MTLVEALTSTGIRSVWLHVVLGGLSMAGLALRRQYPLAVAVGVVVATIVTNPDDKFTTLLALVLVCYTIGSEADGQRSLLGLALVAVPFLAVSVTEGLEPSDLAAALVFFGGPWAVGRALQQRTARATEALDRADRLVREQEEQAAAAVLGERTRIARELHDIVSHSISVITIQTQAVRRRLGPEHSREVEDLVVVEATAREALAEMRRLFGVLRSTGESASLTPQPGLAELDRLLGQVRGSGLAVELVTVGERHALPPGLDLAAYRIVQEALTNTLRHADARRARVTIGHESGGLLLSVEDDGQGLRPDGGAGHGLVGVRERVALYGGTAELGRSPLGGVRLTANLPFGEAS